MSATVTAGRAPAGDGGGLSFAEAAWIWVKIGLLSFGGPAGQIALMQNELVDRRGVVDQRAFLSGLSFSMLLPGPEAQQLATWLGWRLHGLAGGLFAGFFFIAPGALLMIALAWGAASYGDTPWIRAIFYGVAPVVVVIIAQALWKLAGRALDGLWAVALAIVAFVAIYGFGAPFPLIVLAAAVIGLVAATPSPTGEDAAEAPAARVSFAWPVGVVLAFAALIVGVFFAARGLGGADPFDAVAELFTTAAFVTFGGAYAVLPFVAERAVDSYGWLTRSEMVNGLALAETTPGPLILVNVYAGFFAGWNGPGDGAMGAATAALACFYTFAPSFMLILAAAPYVERLQNIAWARRALAGVSAAVVGVIGNLLAYLGEASIFVGGRAPSLSDPAAFVAALDPLRLGIAALAAILAFGFGWSMLRLIGVGAAIGAALLAAGLLG